MFTTPYESLFSVDIVTLNNASSDNARRLIDQDLQRLEDSIRALRSRRNMLAPISQLPPETLSKIFSCCIADCAESINPLEWIRVTHVSRHWRAVALDCPNLWGNLVFSRPRWSEEMLKRSKMASLIVKADLSCIVTPRIFEAVRLALLHAPRIHDLQLRAGSTTIKRLLTSEPSFQAPMIRSLSLSVDGDTRFGADEGFTLPNIVLAEEMPYLTRVELHRINIDWDSQLLKGLTHLTIHHVAASARPTTDQLIDALERMPALEIFDIRGALPQPPGGSSSDRIIDLPQLVLLSVSSTVPECANLVSRITIPTSACIHLSCSGTETTGGDFSGVMKVISNPRGTAYRQEKDSPPEKKIIRVLHVQHEAPISLVVQGWTNAIATHEAVLRINAPDILLHFSWYHSAQTTVDNITASVCEAIPIARLRSLRMAYVNGISPKMWINTFGLLPKLHNVHIAGQSAHALVLALREVVPIEALTSPSVTPEGMLGVRRPGLCRRRSAVPSVYFPQLRSLTMKDVTFEDDDTPATTILSDLQSCLIERSERKAGIQELRLRECSYLYKENVDTLKVFVPTVDWDEIEQSPSEDGESEYGYDEMEDYMFEDYDAYGEEPDSDLDFFNSIF
ncbi:hypothetical protein C0995_006441 [Termitomyces sp. Mi166|nr:hypothetical protein C0995_006441 [Termitomyces sp. Mi166\